MKKAPIKIRELVMIMRMPCPIILLLLSLSVKVSALGVDSNTNSITLALTSEPPSLDSSLSQDTTSAFVLALTNEGLVRIDKRGRVIPAVAERWQLKDRSATFYLRPDARWSNGTPVTAHDFEYAWKRLVDPKTGASGSAFFAYVLENAEEILAGKKPPSTLGIRATDDYTLEVSLSRPVPYILTVLAGTPYFPLNREFVETQKDRYGTDAKNLMSNGPFKLDSWIHNSSMRLTRNSKYWDNESIKLDRIDVGYITSDTRSLYNLFKSGELAALRLDENVLRDASADTYRIQKAPTNCLAWLILNVRPERSTSNLKLRRAIRLAFDRDRYVNNIVGLPGTRKIDSVFTRRINGLKGSFQTEYPAPKIEFNIQMARRLLAQARVELGVKKIPPLILLANETRQVEAEFIQAQLKDALGLEIRVDKQTFKQALVKMEEGLFDIARAGYCGGALQDPVFFAGIFKSTSPFNDGAYASAEYDELMSLTHSTADAVERMKAFGKMQRLLFEDVPIIPTHESTWIYVQDDHVDGFVRYPVVNFSRGYVVH